MTIDYQNSCRYIFFPSNLLINNIVDWWMTALPTDTAILALLLIWSKFTELSEATVNTHSCSSFNHKNLFIMFVCEYQSTNILLLKMTKNINQKHDRKELGHHINLREEQKVIILSGHNMAENQIMINIGLLHICPL